MSGKRIEVSIRINAPIELVWAITQSPARRPEWDVRVERSELLTPGPMGRGARIRNHYNLFGLRSWIDLEYITWEPPRRAAVRMVGGGRGGVAARMGGSWQYQAHPDGSTTWTTRFNATTRGGPLAPLLQRVLILWMARPATEESARRLKRLVEAEYGKLSRPAPSTAPVA